MSVVLATHSVLKSLLVAVVLVLAACGESATAMPEPTPDATAAVDNAIQTVRAANAGGLVAPPTVTPANPPTPEPIMTLSSAGAPPATLPTRTTDYPCISARAFVAKYGSFKSHIGKTACLEGTLKRSSAIIAGLDIHFAFEGSSGIDGVVRTEDRDHFDLNAVHALNGKQVRLRGEFAVFGTFKEPYLRIRWPQEVAILAA